MTPHSLELNNVPDGETVLNLDPAEYNKSPLYFFRLFFSDSMVEMLAEASTAAKQLNRESNSGPKAKITTTDINMLLATIIRACATRVEVFGDALEALRDEHKTTANRFSRVRSALSFDTNTLFEMFNENLKSIVQVS